MVNQQHNAKKLQSSVQNNCMCACIGGVANDAHVLQTALCSVLCINDSSSCPTVLQGCVGREGHFKCVGLSI